DARGVADSSGSALASCRTRGIPFWLCGLSELLSCRGIRLEGRGMSDVTERHRCCLRLTNYYAYRTAFDRAANLLLGSGPVPHLWDLATGRLLRALPVKDFTSYYADWDIALTPDGGRAVASFSSGYHVLVWDTASGEELLRWNMKGVATGMAVTGSLALIGDR